MKRFLRKIFKPKPAYEPAGIIHYGEFRFGDYYAQATPHRSYHVWDGDDYIGEYFGERIEIVEHLHAKDFPRTIEGSRATPEHHSVGGMTLHMCVCGKPLSQH